MIWFVLLLSACGERFPIERRSGRAAVNVEEGNFLSQVLPTTESGPLDLATFRNKPVVLVFAEETCLTCLKEAKGFAAYLDRQLKGMPPRSVQLVHVLVGIDDPEFAKEWKRNTGVVWPVAYEPGVELKNQLCGRGPLPCTLVQSPTKGLGEPHIGFITADELIQTTGTWE
ncbi:MAG: redoxin domain-containing protein [Bdellovibrionales bacterium]|nr:redoxin domain-containing protein [Bdellovibrionales bacterium]